MVNYLFLVIIFLFMAIEIASVYKFFKHKKIKIALCSLIYLLITLSFTLSYFSSRNDLIDELSHLLEGVKSFNLFAILVLILNVFMIIISTFSYVKIIKLEREKIYVESR